MPGPLNYGLPSTLQPRALQQAALTGSFRDVVFGRGSCLAGQGRCLFQEVQYANNCGDLESERTRVGGALSLAGRDDGTCSTWSIHLLHD